MADCGMYCARMFGLCVCLAFLAVVSYMAYVMIPIIARDYNSIPARMTVLQIAVSPRHCCHLACFCVEVDNPSAESCDAMERRSEELSPAICLTNASACPPTGSAAVCTAGPFCCGSCNATCLVMPPADAPPCKCPCPKCSGGCSCCRHVEARLCRLLCNPCFLTDISVAFHDRHGTPRMANITSSFPDNVGAQVYANDFVQNATFLGFYKPSDPSIVHTSRRNPVDSWVAFVFLAFPFFTIVVAITALLSRPILKWILGTQYSGKAIFWATWLIWIGIIWPFLILLPILELSYPTPRAKTALKVLIPLIACIGWLPSSCYFFALLLLSIA
ncbi:hypothetical protein KP509_03G037400 [Ceratopteris richardii]|uniref:Uncharacterized protein n=1 Tax=Ceratopteris richardii TaxID=49495 RepID=A0A8T2VAL9_CERRI|nr:hypothetical protein KP509_03G037400 [Ceratopteris richardii]